MRTVYRALKSNILVIFSASPANFFSKLVARARVFKTPLIVAANKSYWRLDKSAKMFGGDTWSRAETKCVCGEKMRMWTCPDDMYALLGDGGGALLALINF